MGLNVVSYALSKKYANKVGSTITGTSYDYDSGELIFNTTNGHWKVVVNNGMNSTYKQTLDNVVYNPTENTLEVNGEDVVTKKDEAMGDIDFSGMF